MPSAGNKPILRVFAEVAVDKERRKMLEAIITRVEQGKEKGRTILLRRTGVILWQVTDEMRR